MMQFKKVIRTHVVWTKKMSLEFKQNVFISFNQPLLKNNET